MTIPTSHQHPQATTAGKATTVDQGLRSYFLSVYNYMAGALAVTGIVAFAASTSQSFMQAVFGTPLAYLIMFAPLIMVMVLGMRIQKMSVPSAQACFWVYSVLMGLSMSTIFLVFTGTSIARVFLISASVFGAMSLYGYTTKKDLTSFGSFLFMGLIGLIIASVVNLFLQSSALQMALSVVGVLIFTGLTAYDTQKIKNNYFMVVGHGEAIAKAAILGALSLYIDFINLFVMLLHLFGDRR